MIDAANMTLNEVLAKLGYRTEPAGHYNKDIVTKSGWVAFRGDANSVWQWLQETEQILPTIP
ncbi:MAG: hypothetical protein CMK32_09730 [Porticoccaceae bacterium]|nr:hypothetical protein [Porticoccaceae bacterium]